MAASKRDEAIVRSLAGAKRDGGATADDLQGLLLQVVLALLMVFMIAYFMFVSDAKKEQEEQLIDLNRQKLIVATGKVDETRRMRYGLNALMTQGTDGRRVFDADSHFRDGRLSLAPAAKEAFAAGSAAALADYADEAALRDKWTEEIYQEAALSPDDVPEQIREWLAGEVARHVEDLRLDVRGVQRSLAVRVQREIVRRPEALKGIDDASAMADAIKEKSLETIKSAIGAEMMP